MSHPLHTMTKTMNRLANRNLRKATKDALKDPEIAKDMQEMASAKMQEYTSKAIDQAMGDALTPKSWYARNKLLTGLGALGAGGLALKTLGPSGTPVDTTSPLDAQREGAMQAMADFQREVGVPMTMAGNIQHDGMVNERGLQLA